MTRGTLADAGTTDWTICPGCKEMIYAPRLARDMGVCGGCAAHHRVPAPERLAQLLDPGSAELIDHAVRSADPLGFVDTEPYPERLAAARESTGLDEGVLVATGTIEGKRLVTAVMDFSFLGGSLGSAAGELVTRAAEHALAERIPLLLVCASGGARMQEGALALMQMAKTSQALGRLDEAGVLTISLVTDPTYGGVAASFATLCDVIISEPGARLGFAGPRVIEQTIGERLPPGFQTAEHLLEHGFIDVISPRRNLRTTLSRLLAMADVPLPPRNPGPDPVVRDSDEVAEENPWDVVREARRIDRPTTLDYLQWGFEGFTELHGDRLGGDCTAIVGGPAWLAGRNVMVIGHQKGRTAAELSGRNFGMASPAGYRKAARLMRLAAKLRLPVVTLVDTPGAYPGPDAEEQGQAVAIAENIRLMAGLPVPVVTLVLGEGGSGGALALAVADDVLICSGAVYSVISPEGCASILWHDRSMAPAAAAALQVDARALLASGIVDGVLPEPGDGSHSDHCTTARSARAALTHALQTLDRYDPESLVARRRERLRSFGTDVVTPEPVRAGSR